MRAGALTADRGPRWRRPPKRGSTRPARGSCAPNSGRPYKPGTIRGYEQHLRLRVLPSAGASGSARSTCRRCNASSTGSSPTGLRRHDRAAVAPLRAIYRRAQQLGDVQRTRSPGSRCPVNRRRNASPRGAVRRYSGGSSARTVRCGRPRYTAASVAASYARCAPRTSTSPPVRFTYSAAGTQRRRESAKTEAADRRVPIAAPLRDHLDEQLLGVDGEDVFGGPRGSQDDRARRRRDEGGRAQDLPRCRHTYASYMIAAGVNVKALSEFMGQAHRDHLRQVRQADARRGARSGRAARRLSGPPGGRRRRPECTVDCTAPRANPLVDWDGS